MARVPWVNGEECISCGLCVSLAPEVFRFANDGKSMVYDPAGALEQTIQNCIDGCPVAAISWKEG